jgi:hypothetical protein
MFIKYIVIMFSNLCIVSKRVDIVEEQWTTLVVKGLVAKLMVKGSVAN